MPPRRRVLADAIAFLLAVMLALVVLREAQAWPLDGMGERLPLFEPQAEGVTAAAAGPVQPIQPLLRELDAAWDAYMARVARIEPGMMMTTDDLALVLDLAGVPEAWQDDFADIGFCESGHYDRDSGERRWDAAAINQRGEDSRGWLQEWIGWFAAAGEDPAEWQDPVVAARVGVYIRATRGRYGGGGGWSCAGLLGIY